MPKELKRFGKLPIAPEKPQQEKEDSAAWMVELLESRRGSMSEKMIKLWEGKIATARKEDHMKVSSSLDEIRWMLDNHGSAEWCARKGRTMAQHIEICQNQYGVIRRNSSVILSYQERQLIAH